MIRKKQDRKIKILDTTICTVVVSIGRPQGFQANTI